MYPYKTNSISSSLSVQILPEFHYPVDSHLLFAFSFSLKGAIALVLLPHLDLACLKAMVSIPTGATIRRIGYATGTALQWGRYLRLRLVELFGHGHVRVPMLRLFQ
jgi:hypothetical protein